MKIDKGVEKPVKPAEIVEKMKVGDSIFVKTNKEKSQYSQMARYRDMTVSRWREGDGWRIRRDS
jgi:hypothetical protein